MTTKGASFRLAPHFKLEGANVSRLVFRLTHHVNGGRPIVELVEPIWLRGFDVPIGFRTDFASIPWLLWALIPVFGRSCKAAVLHDWLCYTGMPRRARSSLFLQQMLSDGVPSWQAWLQFLAVRWWPGPERVAGESRLQN